MSKPKAFFTSGMRRHKSPAIRFPPINRPDIVNVILRTLEQTSLDRGDVWYARHWVRDYLNTTDAWFDELNGCSSKVAYLIQIRDNDKPLYVSVQALTDDPEKVLGEIAAYVLALEPIE